MNTQRLINARRSKSTENKIVINALILNMAHHSRNTGISLILFYQI